MSTDDLPEDLPEDFGGDLPRKARRGKLTRAKIIAATEVLIARHGPDGFQLQNVTEILGITPPAIYNHFKDRGDLVAQVAEKGGRILNERMRRHPGESILTSLRRNARDYVAFLAENPAHARIILWDTARQGTTGWHGLAASNIEIRDRMRTAFEAAAARGEIRPVRIEIYLQFLTIGAAAAITCKEYSDDSSDPSKKQALGTEDASPSLTLPTPSPEEVLRLQDSAEDLVVRLLVPDLPGTSD